MLGMTLLGLLVGIIMGLTGAGGGILAVPGLMLVMGWNVAEAAPVAMVAVAMSASVGAVSGLRLGLARYKTALLMAIAALPFSSLGLQVAHRFPPVILSSLFALILFYISTRQLYGCFKRSSPLVDENNAALCHMDWQTGKLVWNRLTVVLIASVGAMTGFLTGLLGVGGAFFMVPMLRRLTDIPMQGVIATVLLVTACVTSGSLMLASYHDISLPTESIAPFVMAAVLGMLSGRFLIRYTSSRVLQCSFGLLVLLVGLTVAIRALHGL
ncbi:MAG: sulfite exporter TauE/SafE family protein [Rhodocyclaceae bacterium]|nr:sulfite exporter TauE/SafE family protein [Rhodocyclaceae bacterium]